MGESQHNTSVTIITKHDIPLQYTYFESVTSNVLQLRRTTWQKLCYLLSMPKRFEHKESAPLIKLAVFKEDRVTQALAADGYRSPRCAVNIDYLTGVEGDYDAGEMDLFEAATLLEAAKIECFLHTTPSHRPEAPRWRVLAPVDGTAPLDQRRALLDRVNTALGGVLSQESYASAQAFYIGTVRGAPYEWMHVRGELLKPTEDAQPVADAAPSNAVELYAMAWSTEVEAELCEALSWIPSDDRAIWIKVGQALASYGNAARDLWIEWSQKSDKWRPEDAERWKGFHPNRISPRTIFYLANKYRSEATQNGRLPGGYIRNDNGGLKALHVNLVFWLLQQKESDKIKWDRFSERTMLGDRAVSDEICAEYRTKAETGTKLNWGLKAVSEAFAAIGYTRPTHAVTAYIERLQWDQQPRIDRFFEQYYRLDSSEYLAAAARVLFMAAIWRVLDPGCQADQSLLLVGSEGVGKSFGMGTLFYSDRGWVLEHIPDLHQKDAASALRGKWMVELAEMDAARRSEVETLKAFMTRREEHYRPAYAVHEVTRLRQCILIGTSNDYTILDAMDGNRRFLPLVLGDKPASLDDIKRDRDQLWAEAFQRALLGERHGYLTPMNTPGLEQARQQISREDPYYTKVEEWIADKDKFRLDELIEQGLFIGVEKQTYNLQRRVGKLLRHMGWRTKSVREGKAVKHYWVRVNEYD